MGQGFVLDAARTEPGDNGGVGLDYKDLPRDVKPGDTLLLNDGLLRLTVARVVGEQVHTTVVVGGELSNNKGINNDVDAGQDHALEHLRRRGGGAERGDDLGGAHG